MMAMSHRRPRLHRLRTHQLAAGLQRRPDCSTWAFTWGPISLLWDRSFKRAERQSQA